MQMRARNLSGYPWVGQNTCERKIEWERLYKISIDPYFAHNYAFPKQLQANLAYIIHPWFVFNLFLKLNQIFIYIISYGRRMDQQLMTDQLNIESSDFKPYPISACIHNMQNCSQQQFESYHCSNLKKIDRHVQSRDSHGDEQSCSVRTTTRRCLNSAGLVRYELQTLLHIIWICSQEIFFLPLSFGYKSTNVRRLQQQHRRNKHRHKRNQTTKQQDLNHNATQ